MEEKVTITYRQDGKFWLGHINAYPEYMTQDMTLDELQANLNDIRMEVRHNAPPHPIQARDQ